MYRIEFFPISGDSVYMNFTSSFLHSSIKEWEQK